jgi:hypothetical protein
MLKWKIIPPSSWIAAHYLTSPFGEGRRRGDPPSGMHLYGLELNN